MSYDDWTDEPGPRGSQSGARRTKSQGPGEDYIEVHERIQRFYTQYPTGAVVTTKVKAVLDFESRPYVLVKAKAYRTPDDQHPGVGHSWLMVPGKTPYTNGSELENAETSAWGRAIAAVGVAVNRSIASKDEIKAKAVDDTVESTRSKVIAAAKPTKPSEDPPQTQTAPSTDPAPSESGGAAPEPPEQSDGGMTMAAFKKAMRENLVMSAAVGAAASKMFPEAADVASLSDEERAALWATLDPKSGD